MPDTDIAKVSFLPAAALEFQIPFTALPERLDKVLARLMPQHSRSRLQGWIEGGHVQINGHAARIRAKVGAGDRITVWAQIPPEALARSEEHTSELQSLMRISYAVFCLKKKTNKQRTTSHTNQQNA